MVVEMTHIIPLSVFFLHHSDFVTAEKHTDNGNIIESGLTITMIIVFVHVWLMFFSGGWCFNVTLIHTDDCQFLFHVCMIVVNFCCAFSCGPQED